jgi:putative DNA primase/helicase
MPTDWKQRTALDNKLDELSDDTNVGVVLGKRSRNVVDIDLDTEIARTVAPAFLPQTGWVFGRENALRSHWIYRVMDEPGYGQKLLARGKLVAEYRANNQFTVFPPSVHPSGELIEFTNQDIIGRTTRVELIKALGSIAAVALLEPAYTRGRRHGMIIALSRLSGRACENDLISFVEALCGVTADEEKDQRIAVVRAAHHQVSTHQPYTNVFDLICSDAALSKYVRSKPYEA